jgi:hypothetical protein
MTLQHDLVTDDLFGLEGTLPRPGWVVLDAARDRRFTGELRFDTLPQVLVYLDRGRIYLAERETDASLGARLVDAGTLNAVQLEHGAMRIGDDEHLGRLFERVPSVDRHMVLITAEMMTDECVGWLAHQRVDELRATPYRHHPSGVHRWDRVDGWVELVPGAPLPAPAPDERPVEIAAPEPLFTPEGLLTDDMIQWDEPSWLDERPLGDDELDSVAAAPSPAAPPLHPPSAPDPIGVPDEPDGDWIDRLATDGLPDARVEEQAAPAVLPVPVDESSDRFELIWPSGEVDDQLGASEAAGIGERHPDLDRAGATARVVRATPAPDEVGGAAPVDVPTGDERDEDGGEEAITDDVVLAVRRAVASIETGSLSARRRLADSSPDDDPSRGVDLPSRVVARKEGVELRLGVAPPPTRSVFDDSPMDDALRDDEQMPPPVEAPAPSVDLPPGSADETDRSSALRRLIGSLWRR